MSSATGRSPTKYCRSYILASERRCAGTSSFTATEVPGEAAYAFNFHCSVCGSCRPSEPRLRRRLKRCGRSWTARGVAASERAAEDTAAHEAAVARLNAEHDRAQACTLELQ